VGKARGLLARRDFDYVPGYSKCLHYTTIHEQPWHPFPEVFVYMQGPVSDIWHDMEAEADRQEYCAFDFTTEDTLYTAFVARIRRARGAEGRIAPLATPQPPRRWPASARCSRRPERRACSSTRLPTRATKPSRAASASTRARR